MKLCTWTLIVRVSSLIPLSLLLIQNWVVQVVAGECPKEAKTVHRLGKSRFYILHDAKNTNRSNWDQGKKRCEDLGMTLGKIDNLQTEVLVGRELEIFLRPKAWKWTYYWMNAKFDEKLETYVWQDTKEPIKFANFFLKLPRPKGYGGFYDKTGKYQKNAKKRETHCLAQSLPLALPWGGFLKPHIIGIYGMQTTWFEKPCNSDFKAFTLCESHDPACEEAAEQSIYTEKEGKYFQEFWPMSNRRFVVMWAPKNHADAKKLCEDHRMELYNPREGDDCIIQNLKNAMRRVTTWSFWTEVTYKVIEKTFLYKDGSEVPLIARNFSVDLQRMGGIDVETCASMTWVMEEPPTNPNFCECTYNEFVLGGENCKNPIGVICQHKDAASRKCTTEFWTPSLPPGEYKEGDKVAKFQEFYPFDDNPNILRSAYKQNGKTGPCPKNYRRVDKLDEYWGTVDDYNKSQYVYDYLSSYWLRPEKNSATGKMQCTISRVTYDPKGKKLTRELHEKDCNLWIGFFLCIKEDGGGTEPKHPNDKGRGMAKGKEKGKDAKGAHHTHKDDPHTAINP